MLGRDSTDQAKICYPPPKQIMVLIPTLNEEEGIAPTIAEISDSIFGQHIIVVDGHSRDRTVEIARTLGAEVIFQDGEGKGDALSTAMKFVTTDIKYAAITDADFTYPAKSIPEMISSSNKCQK